MLTDIACKSTTCPADKPRARFADTGGLYCWRRFKIEPPCRLNFEPGLMANL